MKITKLETVQLPEHPQLLWLRVHTDEGVTGTGETFPRVGAARRIIHDVLGGMLIGENPLHIERLWHDMFQALHYHGYAGSEMRAISAVDIALWDILGQVAGLPVCAVLGGKVREATPIYNTCVSHKGYADRELFLDNPAELAESLLDEGITAMKIWPFDELSIATRGHGISAADLKRGARGFKEIRAAVGDRIEIAFEGHACWDLPTAIRIARATEEYDLMWLEDLIPADNMAAMRELKSSTATPLCVSERLFSRYQFLPVLEAEAADFIMPDVCWVGGISELKKIAVLASAYGLPIAPHNCGGPIQTAVYAHACAHIENVYKVETVRAFYHTYYRDVLTQVPRIENGLLYAPDAPGLGTALQPDVLQREDLIVECTTEKVDVPWASGDPWKNDLGNRF